MDYLADSVVDIIPVDYSYFPNGGYYEGNGGYLSPDGGCNMSATSSEPITPMEVPKEPSTFAMSTAFNLQMDIGEDGGTDVVLVSKDAVHFFVRRSRLLSASTNQFGFLLDPYLDQSTQQFIPLTEDSQNLNIVLHIVYGVSFRLYSPPLELLLQTIATLEKYGVALDTRVIPGTPLFDDIVLKMPYKPLEVYIVAAEHDLFELARAASGYLLTISLLSLPRATTLRLNVEYMAMLYNLHMSRTSVLQQLVSRPPDGHAPMFHCGFSECQAMRSAWSVAASTFILKANPDVSAALIRNTLESLKFSLPCMQCQQCVQQRVNEVLQKWSLTPRTICRDTRDFFAVLSRKDLKGNRKQGVECRSDALILPIPSSV